MTTAQRLYQEGRRDGRREGRQEGRQEGKKEGLEQGRQDGLLAGQRRLLLKQLRLRFGSVTRQAMARINKASAEQLERWGERLLTAASLREVFVRE